MSPLFRHLTRHFFSRFFDNEFVSRQGEMQTHIVQILALLAVPGFFVSFYMMPAYASQSVGTQNPGASADRLFFVSYSMLVMGFAMAVQWGSLFPDRRDYLILSPLPLKGWTIFLSKLAALTLFLGLFAVVVNVCSTILLPLIAARGAVDALPRVLRLTAAHIAGTVGGGLFMALLFGSIQGVLLNVLPYRIFRRLSPLVQMAALAVCVFLLLLFPLLSVAMRTWVQQNHGLLYCLPLFWFLGLYETVQSGADPVFRNLSTWALHGLWMAALAFLLTYTLGYQRHSRRALESVDLPERGPGTVRKWWRKTLNRFVLLHPLQRAVFYFISETLMRSPRHRLLLASYAGVSAGLALPLAFVIYRVHGGHEVRLSLPGLATMPLALSFFVVVGLRAAFNLPIDLPANWVFQVIESDARAEQLAGARKWLVLYGLIPLFSLLVPIEWGHWPWPVALYHTVYGLVLSLLLLQILFHYFRKVPFTCAYLPGKTNMALSAGLYLCGFQFYIIAMSNWEQWLWKQPWRVGVFCLAALLLYQTLAGRRDREEFTMTFEEQSDPLVRTLDLG